MLTITVRLNEEFDEETQQFVSMTTFDVQLEHSLVSLSKWESKYEKSFLNTKQKSSEETLDYIKAMVLTPDVPENIWAHLSESNVAEINDYIQRKMTATTVNDQQKRGPSQEIITAELVYYWMVALNIPWEAQHWHLNKLLMLIRVCNIKNQPPKKMNKRDAAAAARNRGAINAQRQAMLGRGG